MAEYRSPALPQFTTSSRVLAMCTTWFFAPWMTLKEADKYVVRVDGSKKLKKRRKRKTRAR